MTPLEIQNMYDSGLTSQRDAMTIRNAQRHERLFNAMNSPDPVFRHAFNIILGNE